MGDGFSDDDFQALDAWLMRRGKAICDIVTLEGFLTAIVIGPNTLKPWAWLPKVFGERVPKAKSLDELNRTLALIMGFYNDIVSAFESDSAGFEPTFFESEVDGERVQIVDEWCWGFLKGMRLDVAGWKPLKVAHPEWLRPMELFGSPAGWRQIDAGDPVKIHTENSVKIAPAVRAIYQFWLALRVGERVMGGRKTRH